MAVNRAKVIESAQKQLAKGNYDKAIAEYQKLVKDDPRDVRTLLKIGDIYTRKGARVDAVRTYTTVAEHYAKQGFFLKAVAVYKQILKLDPGRVDVSLHLAEMYEQLQLVSDALNTYEQVSATLIRTGDIERALETLGKMADLDPDNIPVRIKYAEALSKAGRTEDAALEFERGATLLKDQGRLDDYIKVAERLLYHRAADVNLARELAEMYLERNDAKRALAKLQLAFKANPKDVRTLELLARAFHLLGQTPKTVSVYREIAKIYADANRDEDRARILTKILELDPNDAEARQALAGYAPQPSAREVSSRLQVPPPGAVIGSHAGRAPVEEDDDPELEVLDDPELEVLDDDDDIMILEEDGDEEEVLLIDDDDDDDFDIEVEAPISDVPPEPEPTPAPVAAPGRPSIPPEVAREAQIARLLTECDVFLRYGLKDKVVAQLEQVVSIAPEHVEGRERLKEAYLAAGRAQDAVAQLHALVDLFENDKPQLAKIYLRQVLEIDPNDARANTGSAATALPVSEETDDAIMFVEDADAEGPLATELNMVPSVDELRGLDDGPPTAEVAVPDVPPKAAPTPVPPRAIASPVPPRVAPVATIEDEIPDVATAAVVAPPYSPPTPDAAPRPYSPPPPSAVPMLDAEPASDVLSTAEMAFEPTSEPPADHTAPEIELPDVRAAIPPAAGSQPPAAVSLSDMAPPPPVLEHTQENLAPMSPDEFAGPVDDAAVQAAEQQAVQRASLPPGEIEETLDEADFFLAQALWEEAIDSIEDALTTHPGHPLLTDKLAEIREAAAAAVQQPALQTSDDAFALAEKLAEELDEVDAGELSGVEEIDVESVFDQFKKGVQEQVGLEDSDTHFDLGIAYKEMGLHEDAINEFKLSMSNPQRECTAQTMIGICLIERGKVADGISHFKKGLYAEAKSAREELGLYFELGIAYELLHDPKEALYYFQKVQKRDPDFRGVADKIQGLTQPQAAAPVVPQPSMDDVDRAFDDLLSDD